MDISKVSNVPSWSQVTAQYNIPAPQNTCKSKVNVTSEKKKKANWISRKYIKIANKPFLTHRMFDLTAANKTIILHYR